MQIDYSVALSAAMTLLTVLLTIVVALSMLRRESRSRYEFELRQRGWELEVDQLRASTLRAALTAKEHINEASLRAKTARQRDARLEDNLLNASALLQKQIDELIGQNSVDGVNLERMNEMFERRRVRLETIPSASEEKE